MKNWKTKLFGGNALDFYCWNFAAVLALIDYAR
jgi:hypothetical protein